MMAMIRKTYFHKKVSMFISPLIVLLLSLYIYIYIYIYIYKINTHRTCNVCRLNQDFFAHLQFDLGQLRFAVSKTQVPFSNYTFGLYSALMIGLTYNIQILILYLGYGR
jgi:hypothetical protein